MPRTAGHRDVPGAVSLRVADLARGSRFFLVDRMRQGLRWPPEDWLADNPRSGRNVGETSIIFLWEGCPGAPWGVRIVAPARRPPCRWPARPHAWSPRGQRPPPRWRPLPRLRRGPAALSARDRFPSLPAWPHRARPPGVRVRGPGQRSPRPALRALCLGHASAL